MNTIEMLKELVDTKKSFITNVCPGYYAELYNMGAVHMSCIGNEAIGFTLELNSSYMNAIWEPYIKPVDWSKVPIDAKVMCSTRLGLAPMHYAGLSDKNKPCVWDAGKTSHTTKDRVSGWDEIRLAEEV